MNFSVGVYEGGCDNNFVELAQPPNAQRNMFAALILKSNGVSIQHATKMITLIKNGLSCITSC